MNLRESTIYVTEVIATIDEEEFFLQNIRLLEEYLKGFLQLYNKAH